MDVMLIHAETGEIRPADIGWSWELLFLCDVFFVPLIRRKLFGWVALRLSCYFALVVYITAAWNGQMDLSGALAHRLFLGLLILGGLPFLSGSAIYLSFKGNELSARKLLKSGWTFADPESRVAEYAKIKWRVD